MLRFNQTQYIVEEGDRMSLNLTLTRKFSYNIRVRLEYISQAPTSSELYNILHFIDVPQMYQVLFIGLNT